MSGGTLRGYGRWEGTWSHGDGVSSDPLMGSALKQRALQSVHSSGGGHTCPWASNRAGALGLSSLPALPWILCWGAREQQPSGEVIIVGGSRKWYGQALRAVVGTQELQGQRHLGHPCLAQAPLSPRTCPQGTIELAESGQESQFREPQKTGERLGSFGIQGQCRLLLRKSPHPPSSPPTASRSPGTTPCTPS